VRTKNQENLTAAGKGEFSITSNATADGSQNRRIEIILTPRLDEIAQMLNDID
jgi:chemotaxis protein MotB